jgi:hypothetical protein
MNLEEVEQRVFDILQQSANPLVPLSTILRSLWQNEEFGNLTAEDLLAFLRKHELFHVIDLGPGDPAMLDELKESGIPSGPRVVLKSRIPGKAELGEMMADHMATMIKALQGALEEARREGNYQTMARVSEMLNRAEHLRQELDKLFT